MYTVVYKRGVFMAQSNHIVSMKILVLVFIIFPVLLHAGPAKKITVIKKQNDVNRVKPIVEWVKNNKERFECSDHRFLEGFDGTEYYVVDLNNDGIEEYVFLESFRCCGEYLFSPHIFTHKNGVVTMLEDLITKAGEKHNYGEHHEYQQFFNPVTGQNELFVAVDKKIYICVSGQLDSGRIIYLWENGTISMVHDAFWIDQQRKLFNALYAKKRYKEAYDFLGDVADKYKEYLDPQLYLWIRNDVALAAFHNGEAQCARTIVESIINDGAFGKASEGLKKSVRFNERLFSDTDRSKNKHDFRTFFNGQKDVGNEQFLANLVAATVPEVHAHFMKRNLFYTERQIVDDRYLIVSGHGIFSVDAFSKGFVWCDAQKNISVAATNELAFKGGEEQIVLISKHIGASELPSEFFNALNNWILENELVVSGACFYDSQSAQGAPEVLAMDKIKSFVKA